MMRQHTYERCWHNQYESISNFIFRLWHRGSTSLINLQSQYDDRILFNKLHYLKGIENSLNVVQNSCKGSFLENSTADDGFQGENYSLNSGLRCDLSLCNYIL